MSQEVDAGAAVTAFNMTEEMDEGFVEEGEYIANEFDQRVQRMMQNCESQPAVPLCSEPVRIQVGTPQRVTGRSRELRAALPWA